MHRPHCTQMLFVISSIVAPMGAHAQTVTWDGDCGDTPQGAWNAMCSGGTTSNWDNDMLPMPSDNVIIMDANVRIFTLGPETINALSMTSAGLTGSLFVNGGTVTDSAIAGNIDNSLLFLFAGGSTYTGTLNGPGLYGNSGHLTFNDGFIGTLGTTTTFNNTGTLVPMFEPEIRSGSVINNTGTIQFVSGGFTGAGTLINNGTMVLNILFRQIDLNCRVDQLGGTTAADAGKIRFNAPSEYSGGEMVAMENGTLEFRGVNTMHEFTGLSRISGGGLVSFAAGPSTGAVITSPMILEMNAPGHALIPNVMQLDTTLTNRGRVLFNGARISGDVNGMILNESGGEVEIAPNSAARLISDVPLINSGSVNQRSAISALSSGSTVTMMNESGGVWDMVGLPDSSVLFKNNGTVYRRPTKLDPVIGNGVIACQIDQDGGTIDLQSATTTFENGGTWTNGAVLRAETPAVARLDIFSGLTDTPLVFDATTNLVGTGAPQDPGGEIIIDGFSSALYQVNGTLQLFGAERPLDQEQRIQISAKITGAGTIRNRGGVSLSIAQLGSEGTSEGHFINEAYCLFRDGSTDLNMNTTNMGLVHQQTPIDLDEGSITNKNVWRIGPPPDNFIGGRIDSSGEGMFINEGGFIAENFNQVPPGDNYYVRVDCRFDNRGSVFVSEHMTLAFIDEVVQIQEGVLVSGIWAVEPGGILIFPVPLNTIGANATVTGGDPSIPALGQLRRVLGSLTANEPLNVPGGLDIEDGGEIRIRPEAPIFVPDRFRNGRPEGDPDGPSYESRIVPVGSSTGKRLPGPCSDFVPIEALTFENHAIIEVGDMEQILSLQIDADTTLFESSRILLDLAGPNACTEHDEILITGQAELGGSLEIAFSDGYIPSPGTSFVVLSATGGISGEFSELVSPIYDTSRRLRASYTSNSVVLVETCAADLDSSGGIDFFDVSAFLSAYTSGSSLADMNADGVINFFDVSAFLSAYQSGCS